MPKILEKVREQLLAEAERQIAERGYARTTIRSVALSYFRRSMTSFAITAPGAACPW